MNFDMIFSSNRWKHLLIGAMVVATVIVLNYNRNWNFVKDDQDVLQYFGTEDGIDITFYHGANSKDRLAEALTDPTIKMIEADVIFGKLRPTDEKFKPIMGVGKEDTTDLCIYEFMDTVIGHEGKKGIKLHFKDIKAVEKTLQYLQSKHHKIDFPVWLSATAVPGPGRSVAEVDGNRFVFLANKYYPTATLSLGFAYVSEVPTNTPLTQINVEDMYLLAMQAQSRVSFSVDVAMFTSSLTSVRWLLEQQSRFSLTLVTTISGSNWQGADVRYVSKARKEFPKGRVFYDLSHHKHIWLEFHKQSRLGKL